MSSARINFIGFLLSVATKQIDGCCAVTLEDGCSTADADE